MRETPASLTKNRTGNRKILYDSLVWKNNYNNAIGSRKVQVLYNSPIPTAPVVRDEKSEIAPIAVSSVYA